MQPTHSIFWLLVALMTLVTGCERTSSPSADSPDTQAIKIEWLTDHRTALETAAGSGRPVLLNFTGSDWCSGCIRMRQEVIQTEAFADYAKQNLVLLELDFPRRARLSEELKRQNDRLADMFAVEYFPTFILADSDGKELARKVGYSAGGASAFLEWLDRHLHHTEMPAADGEHILEDS